MDRIVYDLASSKKDGSTRSRYFSEYATRSNIVLLGDPGAGKSHLFRTSAAKVGAHYVTVRAFLTSPVHARGQVLFLDALDEKRAGRGDRDTVDALVVKLFKAAPRKIRLSCRVADWLGESDLASLRPMFEQNGGEPAVLALAALSVEERREILVAEGLNSTHADDFIQEAESRGLEDFLNNPQNLLMLLDAVRTGQWPATRKDLFETSIKLMLEEANAEHARDGSGVYSVQELRPVAGAILAARLISDVEAIGLSDQEGRESVPSYRSLSFLDRDRVRAALTRRIFIGSVAPESVDYAHRTIAEYIGALWLAQAVRGGLPFARLQALLGVDGYPAPELRGLHAWLAVHLTEFAGRVIDADPYGVLTYGDAASLTRSNCVNLVRALGRLSQTDPWFRSERRVVPAIGALSRNDMINEFRSVMRSNEAGFGIRSIVVEALALGMPQPELRDDLAAVLVRPKSTYSERFQASVALQRLGAPGKSALIDAYRNRLKKRANDLRLRIDILRSLYGDPFGPADVVSLIEQIWLCSDELPTGVLWYLVDKLPLLDAQAVLEGVGQVRTIKAQANRRNAWEIGFFVDRLFVRVWEQCEKIDPERALRWLRTLNKFRESYHGDQDKVSAVLRAKVGQLSAVFDYFLSTLVMGENRWLELLRFREITMDLLGSDAMLDIVFDHLCRSEVGSVRRSFFYEAAYSFTWRSRVSYGSPIFDRLYALGETDEALRHIREASIVTMLQERYFEQKIKHNERQEKIREQTGLHRSKFETEKEMIREGKHLGWLAYLARVYFGMNSVRGTTLTPQQSLASIVGESNVPVALEALGSVLGRADLPRLETVVRLTAKRRLYEWWYAILAAMEERFVANNDISEFSDDLLRAALAFDLTVTIPRRREGLEGEWSPNWKDSAIKERPELVRDAYVAIARVRFGEGTEHIEGLRELMTIEALAPYRPAILLEFLRNFPNTHHYRLKEILEGVLATPESHAEFLTLATRVINGAVQVDAIQRDDWLAAAYLLAPQEFAGEIARTTRKRPFIIFDLRDFTLGERGGPTGPITAALPQLEYIARLTGSSYPNSPHPADGWTGNTNAWDASEYFDMLVSTVSANPSAAATDALSRLAANSALASYQDLLRNAQARQLARRREIEYERADWQHTIGALANGPPATVGDLHALLIAHLEDIAARVANVNTDQFKAFWNVNSNGRPTKPRPEEVCRDTLIDFLRVRLAPFGILVEPEGHMVGDKRADISVAMPARKILCELKRDYHQDIWKAMETQLERFYVHDPDAGGFGAYVVFWFGKRRPRQIPAPPGKQARPKSALEMEHMLRALVPKDRTARIAVLVIDVSGDRFARKESKRDNPKNKTKRRKRAGKPQKKNSRVKSQRHEPQKSSERRPPATRKKQASVRLARQKNRKSTVQK